MLNYYYNNLSSAGKAVFDALKIGLQNFEKEIKITRSAKAQDIQDAVYAIKKDLPAFFHVDYAFSYTLAPFASVIPTYLYHKEEYEDMMSSVKYERAAIIKAIPGFSQKSELHKCIAIHNLMTKHITYDYEQLEHEYPEGNPLSYTIYGALVRKKAVCTGFALAFKYLCESSGVNCFMVTGQSLRTGEDHAWNMIKIGGRYAHVDVTWDAIYSQHSDACRYDYFGMTDAECAAEKAFSGFPPANDTSNLDFFSSTGRLIENPTQLQEFLKKAIKEKPDTIYFKLKATRGLSEETLQKLTQTIDDAMGKILTSGGYYSGAPNEKLHIYFYNVEYATSPFKKVKK